jgi:hypothetical protein
MTGRRRYWLVTLAAIAAPLALGCGGANQTEPAGPDHALLVNPATRKPHDEVERAVLAQLPQLAPDTEATIQGHKVVAGAPYSAASGRTCRPVRIRGSAEAEPDRSRLVCMIGNAWAYVPNALRDPAGGSR